MRASLIVQTPTRDVYFECGNVMFETLPRLGESLAVTLPDPSDDGATIDVVGDVVGIQHGLTCTETGGGAQRIIVTARQK